MATSVRKMFTANEVWLKSSDLSRKLDIISRLNSPADRSVLPEKLLELACYGHLGDGLASSSLDPGSSVDQTAEVIEKAGTLCISISENGFIGYNFSTTEYLRFQAPTNKNNLCHTYFHDSSPISCV